MKSSSKKGMVKPAKPMPSMLPLSKPKGAKKATSGNKNTMKY